MTPETSPREFAKNWRGSRSILVTEVSAIGMIAVIRSLGRAGYRVHACSADAEALGLQSRFAACRVVHPDYDDPRFLAWLEAYVAREGIAAIIPSEGFLHAIRPAFVQYAPLLPLNADEGSVYRAFSKYDVHAAFEAAPGEAKLLDHLPQILLLNEGDPMPCRDDLARFACPIFVKADAGKGRVTHDGLVMRAETVEEALQAIARARQTHRAVLVEGFVPGTRAVADFCIWKDEIVSRSMMIARHESPHRGGISTLRAVWWDQEIWNDAERRLRHLGWNGCAMVEYRRDAATGAFHFIEINARYWTGLHTEMYAGIDIPRLQMDAFFGRPSPAPVPPGRPVWCRYTVPGETGYVLSVLKDNRLPLRRKAWAVAEFVLLTFHPGIRSDLNFPGDRWLYLLAWARFLRQCFGTGRVKTPHGTRRPAPSADRPA